MRRAARVDSNQSDIVDALERMGVHVVDLSGAGEGVPDLLLSCMGKWALAEIKRDAKAKLTPAQRRFLRDCKGPVYRLETVEHALTIGAYLRRPDTGLLRPEESRVVAQALALDTRYAEDAA